LKNASGGPEADEAGRTKGVVTDHGTEFRSIRARARCNDRPGWADGEGNCQAPDKARKLIVAGGDVNDMDGPVQDWHPRRTEKSQGVWIAGQGHAVFHNRIRGFWDGLSIKGQATDDPELQNCAIDKGKRLPGFPEESPDLGAYEFGQQPPIYGPR
jgi:hypothetical protein